MHKDFVKDFGRKRKLNILEGINIEKFIVKLALVLFDLHSLFGDVT